MFPYPRPIVTLPSLDPDTIGSPHLLRSFSSTISQADRFFDGVKYPPYLYLPDVV